MKKKVLISKLALQIMIKRTKNKQAMYSLKVYTGGYLILETVFCQVPFTMTIPYMENGEHFNFTGLLYLASPLDPGILEGPMPLDPAQAFLWLYPSLWHRMLTGTKQYVYQETILPSLLPQPDVGLQKSLTKWL